MVLHCTKANHIYYRHAYDKNTVRKNVKCRQFIAYYVIGGTLLYLVGVRSKYTQLQKKRECFKSGIGPRKQLKLKPKCPSCDDNAPELYLLEKIRMLIDFRLLY